MKKLLVSTAFLLAGFIVSAQQDVQWTQNMFNRLNVNPGSTGHTQGFCATFLTRTQWMGFDGKPQTHQFTGDARLGRHGVGLTVFQDKLGIEKSFNAKLSYAYHIKNIGPGELGVGIDVGMVSKSFGGDFIATDDHTFDPSIPNTSTSATSFDAGLGVYYEIPDMMYIGISTLHIPQSTFKEAASGSDTTKIGALAFEQSRHYYIMGGYNWAIGGNQDRLVKPSFLIKTDAASTQFDLTVLYEHNKLVWGGVSYRLEDAISVLAGINVPVQKLKGLKIGAAYDYTTSSLSDHTSGSLEFMIKYCMSISKPIKREVYHSVRFL